MSELNVRPLHDRIIVERVEAEDVTSGGIVLPGTAEEKPAEGIVLAVGPGARLENGSRRPVDVQVGDHILFGKYAGTDVKVNDQELLVIPEEEVIAVIG